MLWAYIPAAHATKSVYVTGSTVGRGLLLNQRSSLVFTVSPTVAR